MISENNGVVLQDFHDCDWRQVITQAKSKDCLEYNSLFLSKAREAEQEGETKKHLVYRLLGDITSLFMRSDNYKEPFGPMMVMHDKRSAILDDFSEGELAALKGLVSEIEDAELRARVTDVIWIRKRDHVMAEAAIDSYLESAMALEDPDQWPRSFDRIERAFRLASSLGKTTGHMDKVIQHIEKVIDKYQGIDRLYLTEKLMTLLCERKLGDPVKYGKLAEKVAQDAEAAHDWPRAQTYWQRKAEWDRIGKYEEKRKESLIRAAETYVRMAEASVKGERPGYMVASSHLTHAIEAYRRITGMKERVDDLHKLLLEYEQKSLQEFGTISSPPMDLTELIDEARETVKGKGLIEAIYFLSQGFRVESHEELQKRIEKSVKQTPLSFMMQGVIVNERGKVVGKKPGLLFQEGDEYENALRPHMFQELKMSYSIYVPALIEPMRNQIEQEHYFTIHDLGSIVLNNPLIPQHREYLFAKGLISGFQGDFVTAIHLLVPQFENSVRYLLEQHGVSVSGIDDEGIQEEYDLNRLLYLPEMEKIFGKDLLFHLQGLLVEKEGANIRNRMAHGLMYPGDFHSAECVFLWALILRLCCLPSIPKIQGMKRGGDGTANVGEKRKDDV